MKKLEKYQQYYDIIHGDKDYEKEAWLLEKAITKYASFPVRRILSFGCGTVGHEIFLAKHGYRVTGLDYSKEMLRTLYSK